MSKMPVHVRYGHPRPTTSGALFGPMSRTYTTPLSDPGTELAYGQVRESLDHPDYRFVVLAPVPDLDVWSVLLLSDSGQSEVTVHGVDYIMGGTRVVES